MRGDRCKYTKRYEECLRAHFSHLIGRRGIVRLLNLVTGEAQVRWDDAPGELYSSRLTTLLREDYEGEEPLDENVLHVTEMTIHDYSGE